MHPRSTLRAALAALTTAGLFAGAAGAQTVTPDPHAAPPPGPAVDAPTDGVTDVRRTVRRWFDGFEFVPRAEHYARLGPNLAPALVALAEDVSEHPIARARAVSAMVHVDDAASDAALERLLLTPDEESVVRRKAARVLAERRGAAAIDLLATALVNAPDDAALREACARGLRHIGPPAFAARDALLRTETSPVVRGVLGATKRIGLD